MSRAAVDASGFVGDIGETTVAVDGTCLGDGLAGTQVATLATVGALTVRWDKPLRVVLPAAPGSYATSRLRAMNGIRMVRLFHEPLPTAELVHRPFQTSHAVHLELLKRMGRRIVVTQQDMIAYEHADYFANRLYWRHHRNVTRATVQSSQAVVCPSNYVLRSLVRMRLINERRCFAIPQGVDHVAWDSGELAPAQLDGTDTSEMIVCIGADYAHKNRIFALALINELQHRYQWRGVLVFAGAHVQHGSSLNHEERYLSDHPRVAKALVRLGQINDQEKAWLYSQSRLVVYPTTSEGFGFIPFEAAHYGIPCLFAPVTSLGEILPNDLARIVPWETSKTAENAWLLLRDGADRSWQVEATRQVAKRYTWQRTAAELSELYTTLLRLEPRRSAPLDRAGVVIGPMAAALVRFGLPQAGPNTSRFNRTVHRIFLSAARIRGAAPFRLGRWRAAARQVPYGHRRKEDASHRE